MTEAHFGAKAGARAALPRRSRIGWAALALLGLSACSQFQPYQRADLPLPADWHTGTAPHEGAASPGADPSLVPLAWDQFVQEPQLRALIEQALRQHTDVRIAQRQVDLLQAQWQQRRAAQGPSLGAALEAQVVGGDTPGTDQVRAGLQVAGWELDFFGRLQSLSAAAQAQYLASLEGERFARVSLVAALASAWLDWLGLQAQLELSQRSLDNRNATLHLMQRRQQQGLASAQEVQQAHTLVQAARLVQAQQQRQLQLALHQLQALLGAPQTALPTPTALPLLTDKPELGSGVLQPVAVGLPAQVLLQRPDVRAAENRLAAAQAHIGAARAAFFPRIALTAQLGSASSELSGLFASGSWGWSLAPQVLMPLLDRGANQAGLAQAQAERDIALLRYQQAIEGAFREVRDALANQALLRSEYAAQQALLASEQERLRLAQRRLKAGAANQLEWLDAERSVFAAEQQLLQLRLAQLHNRVALYRASGGH